MTDADAHAENLERREVVYQGHVQGVGFRATAQGLGERHGVTGWVRNEPNGTVRLQAQGEPSAVRTFLKAVREAMATHISDVHEGAVEPEPGESSFRVAY